MNTLSARNGGFVLFLFAILVYSVSFAWHILTSFDLVNLVRDVNIDDSFYYFQIAKNFANGQFSTFDGGITRTNGYHPAWALFIIPFYWIFDLENALFAIKAYEILLIAGSVVLISMAARLADLPWILLIAVLPALYNQQYLFIGTEAALVLFFIGMVFLAAILFLRNPDRYIWPLTLTAFILPFARLEFIVFSLSVTGLLTILLISRAMNHLPSQSSVKSFAPLLGACTGILTYFTWNGLVFGGITPVSGAIKLHWSRMEWARDGGYDLVENLNAVIDVMEWHLGEGAGLLIVLEVSIYTLLIWSLNRRSHRREDHLFLVFMICVFSLGLEHLSRIIFSALNLHPSVVAYTAWYYVSLYLLEALIVSIRCYMIIYIIRRLNSFQSISIHIREAIFVFAALVLVFITNNFAEHWRFIDQKQKLLTIDGPYDWLISSYEGALMLNRILPENSIVGSWDAGIVGYMSRFPVVNLDGLVNSYDYYRAMVNTTHSLIHDSIGIDWYANIRSVSSDRGYKRSSSRSSAFVGKSDIFEGNIIESNGGDNDDEHAFYIWPNKQLSDSPDNTHDYGFNLWSIIQPNSNFQIDDILIVVDGRLVQIFVKHCVASRHQNEFLVIYGTEDIYFYSLGNMRRNFMGLCVDAFLLPFDIGPVNRIAKIDPKHHDGKIVILGTFEDGFDDWQIDGDAITNHRDYEGKYEQQQKISGNVGPGFLTSYHPNLKDQAIGMARSPEFTAQKNSYIVFRLAGGEGGEVGVRLLSDGKIVRVWHGRNSEHFEHIQYSLAGVTGKMLQLEIFDQENGGWGHVMIDHIMLIHPKKL